jgi:hypothetical protein
MAKYNAIKAISEQLKKMPNSRVNNSKSELYNKYIKKFDLDLKESCCIRPEKEICKNCNKENTFKIDPKTSCEICVECGLSVNCIYNNESPVYTDNIEQVIVFNYKRNNHFQECLNQLQAKENTTIPACIIRDLSIEFKKYNITDPKQFTNALVQSYLKKLKYNKYYEHIPFIKDKLGIKPPIMSSDLEETLCNLFIELQSPYSKFCPDDRVNFLNYYYTAYKLCELLGETQYLQHFPMLKDKEKRVEQDNIWKKICTELNWEFIPTI